jgi:hypothetical protein
MLKALVDKKQCGFPTVDYGELPATISGKENIDLTVCECPE